jgi:hypothetical protein
MSIEKAKAEWLTATNQLDELYSKALKNHKEEVHSIHDTILYHIIFVRSLQLYLYLYCDPKK